MNQRTCVQCVFENISSGILKRVSVISVSTPRTCTQDKLCQALQCRSKILTHSTSITQQDPSQSPSRYEKFLCQASHCHYGYLFVCVCISLVVEVLLLFSMKTYGSRYRRNRCERSGILKTHVGINLICDDYNIMLSCHSHNLFQMRSRKYRTTRIRRVVHNNRTRVLVNQGFQL